MHHTHAHAIEAWFSAHDGDGEFVRAAPAAPYSVIGPRAGLDGLIFTTKPRIVASAIEEADGAHWGMIGRPGLPDGADVPWLRSLMGTWPLLFLGDLDPVDLMIFHWLREHLPAGQLTYLGVGDRFLQLLALSAPAALSIPLAATERDALAPLHTLFSDMRETVGPACALILEQGHKVELEAIVSAKQATAPLIPPASAGATGSG